MSTRPSPHSRSKRTKRHPPTTTADCSVPSGGSRTAAAVSPMGADSSTGPIGTGTRVAGSTRTPGPAAPSRPATLRGKSATSRDGGSRTRAAGTPMIRRRRRPRTTQTSARRRLPRQQPPGLRHRQRPGRPRRRTPFPKRLPRVRARVEVPTHQSPGQRRPQG